MPRLPGSEFWIFLSIMVGAMGPRMLRILATYADEWNIPWRQTVEELNEVSPRADEACEKVGRDPATLRRSACLQVDLPGWESWPPLWGSRLCCSCFWRSSAPSRSRSPRPGPSRCSASS